MNEQPFRYKVPFSEISLMITPGRTLDTLRLFKFLNDVNDDIKVETISHGRTSPLPSSGFDRDSDGLEFSVYSPPEIPKERQITWQILKDVSDGLNFVELRRAKGRELFFRVVYGRNDAFAGYGHLVAKRGAFSWKTSRRYSRPLLPGAGAYR